MTADHKDSSVRPPVGGDQPPAARFEIVLRGYDRRQVEEHISTLERTIAQQHADLEQARRAPAPSAPSPHGVAAEPAAAQQSGSVFEPPKPGAERESSGGGLKPEMISSFTSRLQSILQAAEDEAEEVRNNARTFAQAEEQATLARVEELERRRQSVLSELGRVRTQLEGLLGPAERPAVTAAAPAGSPQAGAQQTGAPQPGAGSERAPDRGSDATTGSATTVRAEFGGARPSSALGRPTGPPNSAQPYPVHNRPGQQVSGQQVPGQQVPSRPGRTGGPGAPMPMRQGQPAPQSGPQQSGPQSGPQQPKSRPSPSPRPRPAPNANLPGVEMTQGPIEPIIRNGNGRSDDDSSFGSGAR
ncbi:MAG: hypothetical protein M3Z25_10790 [Actinomycetota bacterium]|nr:hypothetical protein [Actinomycetota bacterium]